MQKTSKSTIHQNGRTPFPDPAYLGALAHWAAHFLLKIHVKDYYRHKGNTTLCI